MLGEAIVATEEVIIVETDGKTVMMDPLLEMIAGRNRFVTTAGIVIAEENEEEDHQDGKKIL